MQGRHHAPALKIRKIPFVVVVRVLGEVHDNGLYHPWVLFVHDPLCEFSADICLRSILGMIADNEKGK